MNRFNSITKKEPDGFTIIELMMATLIFGLVLLVITGAVAQFTRVYYKGVTQSTTENTATTVVNSISQAIQFDGGVVTPYPGSGVLCIGNEEYKYAAGQELSDTLPLAGDQTSYALVLSYQPGCNASSDPSWSGTELLAPKMRLSNLVVTNIPGTNLYTIDVRIVYGDQAVLTNPSTASDASCQSIVSGTQFCAVSDVTTTVLKQVN